jgi:hypothetical protein
VDICPHYGAWHSKMFIHLQVFARLFYSTPTCKDSKIR